ncbi:serine hydrolase domain-containing protein [Rhodotorula paludigena]|uniref:serine hydrolase domain-containing protein n=1 Tax=Rhodotorula paludigena TaxID=86838 RepID=UPI00317A8EA3
MSSASLQSLLEAAVARGAAPGLAAVAFNRDGAFAQAATGETSVNTHKRLTLDTVFWLASTSKTLVSLAALILAEKHAFDLDSHDDLVNTVPELAKDYPGTKVWDLFDGKDDEGNWKFKKAKVGITLRHLLTHTAGFNYSFVSEAGKWTDGELEKEGIFNMKGDLRGINVPREYEADQGWSYGRGPGFIGLFITRKSGLTLRQALRTLIFDPLGLAKDDIDTFLTPALRERYIDVAARHPVDGSFVSLPFHFETPQYEGDVPEGMSVLADAPACATLPAFAKILQAFLNDTKATPAHEPLLSPEAWAVASADDLEKRGLSVGQHPFVEAADPTLATTREKWAVPKDPASVKDDSLGFTLMQTAKHRFETSTGLQPGTLEWSGLANTYFFVDAARGLGAVVSGAFFPWGDPKMLDVRDEVFKWAGENAPKA